MKTALAIVLLSPSLFFVWLAVRGMYRYYRDNKPNQYRVHRSRWEDSRPVDSRDLMAAHWRMVGRK